MLSVAQAVHHPETPGSASKHSTLGHSWSSERSNMLKRRQTESDCSDIDKKFAKSCVDLTKHFHINEEEITLTLISKNNNQNNHKDLSQDHKQKSPTKREMTVGNKMQDQMNESDESSAGISFNVLSFLEKSDEVQLMKINSNKMIKSDNQNEKFNNILLSGQFSPALAHSVEKLLHKSEEKDDVSDKSSVTELSEVTIEPCTNFHKSKTKPLTSPSTRIQTRSSFKTTQSKLEKAQELLKKKENVNNKPFPPNINPFQTILTESEMVSLENYDYFGKSDTDSINGNDFISSKFVASTFDEISDVHAPISTVTDYEPFNVGITCECYYGNNKDRPYYTRGFPNPPSDNRCWINATLQALFTLPVLNKLDSLDIPQRSKLLTSLSNMQDVWRKGNIESSTYDQTFCIFKQELSVLDQLYPTKAQQDVSEFIMSLLNFIKSEFEKILTKESQSDEIENIPNNDQDGLRKSQNSTSDVNKRLPLADISVRQLRNNHHRQSRLQDDSTAATNSSSTKSKNDNQIEENSNPIDDYFSVYMVENYTCDNCSVQRQQKIENLMLFIDLPSEDRGITENLIDMINATYALEHRNMTCESCKHNIHSMVTKFKKCPKILTVQVKRYEMSINGHITKKSTLVEIPRLLKIDSLVINNNEDSNYVPEYEPICIISHIGDRIDSGHYISFVKHEDQWFYYDDINVKLVSADEVFKCVQNNVYVIFFQDTELR